MAMLKCLMIFPLHHFHLSALTRKFLSELILVDDEVLYLLDEKNTPSPSFLLSPMVTGNFDSQNGVKGSDDIKA